MSGGQGPLETRPKTTVATAAELEGLDATPFVSGELATVLSLSTPGNPALFVLQREDGVSQIDHVSVLSVSPEGASGRWLRVSAFFGNAPFSNVSKSILEEDQSISSVLFTPLLSTEITFSRKQNLLITANVSGHTSGASGQGHFAIQLDSESLPQVGQVFGSGTGLPDTLDTSSFSVLKTDVSAGLHTVTLYWKTSSPSVSYNIFPVTRSDFEGASLIVQEIH